MILSMIGAMIFTAGVTVSPPPGLLSSRRSRMHNIYAKTDRQQVLSFQILTDPYLGTEFTEQAPTSVCMIDPVLFFKRACRNLVQHLDFLLQPHQPPAGFFPQRWRFPLNSTGQGLKQAYLI